MDRAKPLEEVDVFLKSQVVEEDFIVVSGVDRRPSTDLLLDDTSSSEGRSAIGQGVEDLRFTVSSVSHDRILASSLHLSGQIAQQAVTLAAETKTAANTAFSESIVIKQVSQLLCRLLLQSKSQLKLVVFAKDLGDLGGLGFIIFVQLVIEVLFVLIFVDAFHVTQTAAGQVPLDEYKKDAEECDDMDKHPEDVCRGICRMTLICLNWLTLAKIVEFSVGRQCSEDFRIEDH